MKVLVRWRQEGETVIDCKSTEDALDKMMELIKSMDLPGFYGKCETEWATPEMLDAKIVGPS